MKEVYQVLSGALGQEHQLTQIANNLANISSVGYKQDRGVFEDVYAQALKNQGLEFKSPYENDQENLAEPCWPMLIGTYTDFTPGAVETTNQELDVAIRGEGFFQLSIEGQDGVFYTRAGNFQLNLDSELVTPNGDRVLNASGGVITLDLEAGEPVILPTGEIMQNGEEASKLGVVTFENPQQLVKIGESMFRAPTGTTAELDENPQLVQGALESSNVNGVEEVVRMIQTQRIYETNQKVIQTIDELAEKRINAVMS